MNTAEDRIPSWWEKTPEGKKQLAEELAEKESRRLVLVRELAEREAKLNAVLPELNKAVGLTHSKAMLEQGRLDACVLAHYSATQALARAQSEAGLDGLRKELALLVPPALEEFLNELQRLTKAIRGGNRSSFREEDVDSRKDALGAVAELTSKAEELKIAAIEDVTGAIEDLRREIPEFAREYFESRR